MSERNEEMVRLLVADAPASNDLAFEIAVAERIEQRRFRRGLAMNAAFAAASTLVLAILMPGQQAFWQANFASSGNIVIAGALFAFTLLGQRWVAQRS